MSKWSPTDGQDLNQLKFHLYQFDFLAYVEKKIYPKKKQGLEKCPIPQKYEKKIWVFLG